MQIVNVAMWVQQKNTENRRRREGGYLKWGSEIFIAFLDNLGTPISTLLKYFQKCAVKVKFALFLSNKRKLFEVDGTTLLNC